ncbi:MAG: hypothetical protein DRP89_05540 [Candidatus Neomarinimicrobiota bacterium]|nr:MAG: hypothetical protein DRP89_05540 [Candidatus Neomarinimicrobiota bacterium]
MCKNVLKRFSTFLLLILTFFLINCDDFEKETYKMEDTDEMAAEIFGDTILINISSVISNRWIEVFDSTFSIIDTMTNVTDTVIIYDTTFTVLDTLVFSLADGRDTTLYYDTTIVILDTLDAPTNTVIYNRTIELDKKYTLNYFILDFGDEETDTVSSENYTEILDSLQSKNVIVCANDTTYNIATSSSYDTTYLRFNNELSEEVVFYFTDYVKMNIIDGDGNTLDFIDDSMPFEIIAGCIKYEKDKPYPKVKSRYVYDLEMGGYLLQLITTDQTEKSTFYAVILYEQ